MAHIKEESLEPFGGGPEFFDLPSERRGIVYDVTLDTEGELVSFSVRRLSPSAPRLTGRIFREARVETVVMGVRQKIEQAESPGPWGNPLKGMLAMLDPTGQVDWTNPRRPGRPRRTDLEVALIARRYVSAVTELGGNGAAGRVASELGLSKSTILGILNDARSKKRGLLSRAPKGRAGGRLTEKATALLDDFDDYEREAPKHGID